MLHRCAEDPTHYVKNQFHLKLTELLRILWFWGMLKQILDVSLCTSGQNLFGKSSLHWSIWLEWSLYIICMRHSQNREELNCLQITYHNSQNNSQEIQVFYMKCRCNQYWYEVFSKQNYWLMALWFDGKTCLIFKVRFRLV